MKNFIKAPLRLLFKGSDLYLAYMLGDHGFLHDVGWFRSARECRSVDHDGNPIPWYTYPSISFLKERVLSGLEVFEYGSGASTLWWAHQANHVVSCEHDSAWYNIMLRQIPANAELIFVAANTKIDYPATILRFQHSFDIVVIDGIERVACAKPAVQALTTNGIIIWDNSERLEYTQGYEYLSSQGFRRLAFYGFGPINNYNWETSIFYRDNNIFGI